MSINTTTTICDPESNADKDCDDIDKRMNSEGFVQTPVRFALKLMLVATFLEDSLRISTNFSAQANRIAEQWLDGLSPELAGVVAATVLHLGLVVQFLGAMSILSNLYPSVGTKALLSWTVLQPMLYAQYSNTVLMAGSISVIGGLLLLLPLEGERGVCARTTRVAARWMVPAVSVAAAWSFGVAALYLDETMDLGDYFWWLSVFVANCAAILVLAIGTTLVVLDAKTHPAALVLAIVNLGCAVYQHPWFRYAFTGDDSEWMYSHTENPVFRYAFTGDVDGMWLYSHTGMSMTDLFLVDDPSVLYDLHRYYFFLGLSSSGALLLLAHNRRGATTVATTESIEATTTSKESEQN